MRPEQRHLAIVAVAIAIGSSLIACDGFMTVRGRVTDCSSGSPIVGTRATLTLIQGKSDAETSVAYAGSDGRFEANLNEPPSASARLVLDKPGYVGVTRDYDEAPEGDQDFCLTPASN